MSSEHPVRVTPVCLPQVKVTLITGFRAGFSALEFPLCNLTPWGWKDDTWR